jgi:hypothetical protein
MWEMGIVAGRVPAKNTEFSGRILFNNAHIANKRRRKRIESKRKKKIEAVSRN